MGYYQEIILTPPADINIYFLWQKVSQQVHLALVGIKDLDDKVPVGISFPQYDAGQFQLGCKMYLFAEKKEDLEKINAEKWLNRLSDYVQVNAIEPVPQQVKGYACFKHVKLKGNKEKLARRRAKRKGETFEQALGYYANYEEEQSKLPFINMISQTNGEHFRIYIEKQNCDEPYEGTFSCYGLSNKSTVPLF